MRHLLACLSFMVCLSVAAPAVAQNDKPSAQPEREQQERARRGMMNMFRVDVDDDPVLETIRAAVNPTDEQMKQIVEAYKQLRQRQMRAFRDTMMQRMREMRESGERADREDRAAIMRKVMERIGESNEEFLHTARSLLREDQLQSWDACAAGLELQPFGNFRRGRGGALDPARGPEEGKPAPDFALVNLNGQVVTLNSLLGKPTVIEFGSYTCPIFRGKVNSIAKLQEQFGDRVNWIMIYTYEAHASDGDFATPVNARAGIEIPQHQSFFDRVRCAKRTKEQMNLNRSILVDNFENSVTKAYSGHPNRGYVIDAEGIIRSKQVWIDPGRTRRVLEQLLTANETAAADSESSRP